MEVKRIVLDELPEMFIGCTEIKAELDMMIIAKDSRGHLVFANHRIYDCFLEVEEECVWVIEKTSDGQYKKNHACEPNCIYWGKLYEKQINCPNCNKRIKYVESGD